MRLLNQKVCLRNSIFLAVLETTDKIDKLHHAVRGEAAACTPIDRRGRTEP